MNIVYACILTLGLAVGTALAAENYNLPVLGEAADGEVLTAEHQPVRLHDLMAGKPVLLSFIYSTCNDVNGCPLATQILHKIGSQLQSQPELAGKLRLLTLSFNPQHDSPEVMRQYGAGFNTKQLDWQFLTTASEAALQPILDGYGQSVQKIYDSQGRFTGTYTHLLRVYLIDAQHKIRNIYSLDFLRADLVSADLQALLNPSPAAPLPAASQAWQQAGDNRQNYQHNDYQTHSLALAQRHGQAAKLISYAQHPPLGLPKLPVPADNPLTPAKIELGRLLFYDRRLSLNNTMSCAMCHIPEQGFTNNEMATAVGIEGRSVRRNSPTLYNVAYAEKLFHDGRENRLEQQVWGPLLAANEMANPAIASVVAKISANPDYQRRFKTAFRQPANMQNIGAALASYLRTLNSADSGFDRWYYAKQTQAISAAAQRGFALFTGKAGCNQCHLLSADSALFTDQLAHNTGIGYGAAMGTTPAKQHLQIAPGQFIDADSAGLQAVSSVAPSDLGYYEISQNPADRWRYKTPTLRNIALTAPYMHNGALASLTDVVNFYNQGGIANENLSPLIKPLGLNTTECADLVAFLQTLTGSNIQALVEDGFAAPVGDVGQP
ncbi:SCO family protein [Methylomonas paludis]|uniref:Methylamine utilization protein MauG n=1 Tax=Methylomonas paludis TaxID=1173101 RepID=A0A975R9S5_9GAMM|nr:cytochrome c peroxidase [Methylomonas paludis]QWF71735.1 SCO family protein [Methylomonas paludis]